MAILSSVTHIPVLNIQHLFKPFTTFYITTLILYLHLFNSTFSIPITPSDTKNYLPLDDPNITNLMVSHYDCAKQHNLRQFNLLNVKQCTEAPSDIKHASVKARVYVRAKAKRIKAFKCVAYAKKERKICFQESVKHRRVDRTVWNHNTLPLPVTLDPAECKNIIRHLNGTNDKILNNLQYNKTFTLLEDHYFQERLEQYQTPFTVYQLNKMYTGTFTFMPADENWMYDPTKKTLIITVLLSTSLSNLLDNNTSDYAPSQDTSSLFVPKHRYNLRDLPSRRLSTDTSTLNFSTLSSNSALRLVRQHAQPLSSDTSSSELFQSPYFTSGFETA